MAEPIKMLVGDMTYVSPSNHAWGVHIGATWRMRWNDLCGGGDTDSISPHSILKKDTELMAVLY